jgi:V/A-type H+-transporting ATPase subunit K
LDQIILAMGWIGIYAPVSLGAIGSIIGSARAGQAACGALLETESGHGRFIGVSAMPSSQTIYGIVVMLTLNRDVTLANSPALFAIGLLSGLALLFSAVYQGNCCASSINVSKNKPEIFGLSIAPAAVVEGFAVFAFVFALLLSANIQGAA